MLRRRFIGGMLILAVVACSGCLFEPRTAERPSGQDEYPWIVPNSPKDVFLNLASGLASNADSNYDRSLDASFTFIPTDQDATNLGADKFADWTKAVELEWLRRVKTGYVGARSVQFGDENGNFTLEDVEVGRAIYEGNYEIKLKPAASAPEEIYAGIARFTLVYVSQGWVITEWRDLEASGEHPTSGYLRGTLRATR
jgi:hypothetical protein